MSTTVYKNVDVSIEIDLDDVTEFIEDASPNDLDEIARALAGKGVNAVLAELDAATVRHLIERVNIFGVEDMLDDLKREGERIGVYLKGDKS